MLQESHPYRPVHRQAESLADGVVGFDEEGPEGGGVLDGAAGEMTE
jgi:hypothetical protein